MKIERNCLWCGKTFFAFHYEINRGGGKFCCPDCSNASHRTPIEVRFWKKVDKKGENECWLWTGTKNKPGGYGTINREKAEYAHRISWELHNSKIPPGLFVLHTCDTPSCVNPKHLVLGTQQDNMQDMVKKGRHGWTQHPESKCTGTKNGSYTKPESILRGSKSGMAKLDEDKVASIRERHKRGEATSVLAAEHKVSMVLIQKIVKREIWKHIS